MRPNGERRCHTRVQTALPVRCQTSTYVDGAAIALDLSLSGAQILVNKNYNYDGPLELEIELGRRSRLMLRGRAVWSSQLDDYNALVGIEFGGLGANEQRLTNWLDEHCRFTELLYTYCEDR